MGCGASRVSVSPLQENANSPSAVATLNQEQTANNLRLAWSGETASARTDSRHEAVEEPSVFAAAISSNIETNATAAAVLPAFLTTSTHPKGAQEESCSHIRSPTSYSTTSNNIACRYGVTSTAHAMSNAKSTAEVSDVKGGHRFADEKSDEFTLTDQRDSQNSFYSRLTQLKAKAAHSGSSADGAEVNNEGNGIVDIGVGRSRSIQSLRFYHETHSDHSPMVSVTKSVVKALISRTISNYNVVDATSLDWEMLADSVKPTVMAQWIKESMDKESTDMLHASVAQQSDVRTASPSGSKLKEENDQQGKEWTVRPQTCSKTTNPSQSPVSLGLTMEPSLPLESCTPNEHTGHLTQSQQTDTFVSWLSPTVSRKVSSASGVSNIPSQSVTSKDGLEEFVEWVSSALTSGENSRQPSAIQMLVLQPSLVAGSLASEDKMCADIGLDKVMRAELQTAEIGESEELLSVHELYNLLNAGIMSPYIHDPFYILMLDARTQPEYQISHVITASWHNSVTMDMRFLINAAAFLDRYSVVVVYDETSARVSEGEGEGSGPRLVQKLEKLGVGHVSLLAGGLKAVQESYPFLCDTKAYWSEDERQQIETFPSAILPGKLYQGNASHASSHQVFDCLCITHVVNATVEHPNWFDHQVKYMRILVADERESHLFDILPAATKFIMSALSEDGTVLVHCNQGVSRSSTITIAFLMERYNWTLETSYEFLKDRRPGIRPNRGFLEQLSLWEKSVHGRISTDINELWS